MLEEGVVEAPEDVDFGMIMGTGWAPFRGGPLRYADARGLPEVVRRLDELADPRGRAFSPVPTPARAWPRKGGKFYAPAPRAAPTPPPGSREQVLTPLFIERP